MKKILITGGSGFIGTNLIESLIDNTENSILNIDNETPKIQERNNIWQNVDIRDLEALSNSIEVFKPELVIHLAARTDLDGKTLKDYDANTKGVSNLLAVLKETPSVKRVVFASSMYVCEPGYSPKSFDDYAPHTVYGESKVLTEKIIKEENPSEYTWSIIRPTSIWGPWFGEPYANFFNIVRSGKYFHMGERACSKTYGYIDNALYQIMSIVEAEQEKVNKKIFYLGDYTPYPISEWADEIAKEIGIKIPRIPFFLFRFAGWGGDILKTVGIKFPMTSFRLKNMTTDNIHDLFPIQEIAPNLPISRIVGVKKTMKWINSTN
nr:NAD(P)-dependent oxidoreductase [uncultured Draconibacterium sp.]